MGEVKPPERIWLLDYGHDECTWCDDPSPSGEDHSVVEYVRADVFQARNEQLEAQQAEAQAALDKAAYRFERCANMIAEGFGISGIQRAEHIIKARHFALEARALTPGCEHQTGPIGDVG